MKAPRILTTVVMMLMFAALLGCARVSLKCRVISADPGWIPVATEGLTVRNGQRLRFEVKARPGVYLYMLHVGTSGAGSLLYPAAEGPDSSNYLPGGTWLAVPDPGWIRVAPPAGLERIILVAARHRIPEIDRLAGRDDVLPEQIDRILSRIESRHKSDYRLTREIDEDLVKFKVYSEEREPELVGEIALDHQR